MILLPLRRGSAGRIDECFGATDMKEERGGMVIMKFDVTKLSIFSELAKHDVGWPSSIGVRFEIL